MFRDQIAVAEALSRPFHPHRASRSPCARTSTTRPSASCTAPSSANKLWRDLLEPPDRLAVMTSARARSHLSAGRVHLQHRFVQRADRTTGLTIGADFEQLPIHVLEFGWRILDTFHRGIWIGQQVTNPVQEIILHDAYDLRQVGGIDALRDEPLERCSYPSARFVR